MLFQRNANVTVFVDLVLASSGLAGFQLLQIPIADLHVALVVVHALCELLCIYLTASSTPIALLGLLSLCLHSSIVLSLLSWSTASAAEEAADCVTN